MAIYKIVLPWHQIFPFWLLCHQQQFNSQTSRRWFAGRLAHKRITKFTSSNRFVSKYIVPIKALRYIDCMTKICNPLCTPNCYKNQVILKWRKPALLKLMEVYNNGGILISELKGMALCMFNIVSVMAYSFHFSSIIRGNHVYKYVTLQQYRVNDGHLNSSSGNSNPIWKLTNTGKWILLIVLYTIITLLN